MKSVGARYLAAVGHFDSSNTHAEGQQDAFTKVEDAYQALTEHAGNTLLEGRPSDRRKLQRAAEDALSAYEEFM